MTSHFGLLMVDLSSPNSFLTLAFYDCMAQKDKKGNLGANCELTFEANCMQLKADKYPIFRCQVPSVRTLRWLLRCICYRMWVHSPHASMIALNAQNDIPGHSLQRLMEKQNIFSHVLHTCVACKRMRAYNFSTG